MTGRLQITDQDVRTVQPLTQLSGISLGRADIQLGAIAETSDGRGYSFGFNNASTSSVAGNLQTGQAAVANHSSRTIATAVAAGSMTVQVPVGATAVTQDQYIGGFLSVISGTAPLINLRIRSNSVAGSNGTTTVALDEPLPLAFTTSTVVSLLAHPNYLYAITTTTVAQNNYIGVPNVAVPVSNYAWLQVTGYCVVTTDTTTFTKNCGLVGSAATAGCVAVEGAGSITQNLGYGVDVLPTSGAGLAKLQII